MKVDEMDKYQVTENMKLLKEWTQNPNTHIFDLPKEIYEEIINPPVDKDGFVHKYYLSDETKSLIETVLKKK